MRAAVAILLVLSGSFGGVAMGQDRSNDEQQVRARDNEERMAALRRDVPALEQLWSDHFVLNAPNNKVVVGKRAVMEAFVRSGVINFARFDRDIELITADGPYVIIMGLETVEPLTDAPAAGLVAGHAITRRFTNVWKREDGTWRLFLRHANVIPNHPR